MPLYIYIIAGLIGVIIGLEIYHWVDKHGGVTFKIEEKNNERN